MHDKCLPADPQPWACGDASCAVLDMSSLRREKQGVRGEEGDIEPPAKRQQVDSDEEGDVLAATLDDPVGRQFLESGGTLTGAEAPLAEDDELAAADMSQQAGLEAESASDGDGSDRGSDSERDRFSEDDAPHSGSSNADELPALGNRLGSRPKHLSAPKDTLAYEPVLTPLIESDGPLYRDGMTSVVSFNRIYGRRCIAGEEYVVPKDGDGLHMFLREIAAQWLDGMLNQGGALPEAAEPYRERLQELVDKMFDPSVEMYKMTLELPQLFHGADKHTLMLHDENAALVHDSRLCVFGGDQFRPLRLGSEMPKMEDGFRLSEGGAGRSIRADSTSLTFEWFDVKLRLSMSTVGGSKICISAGSCPSRV